MKGDPDYSEGLAALREEQRPFWGAISRINSKYYYRSGQRSEKDYAVAEALWANIRCLDDMFNISHPMPPCSACGFLRRASMSNNCFNTECERCLPVGG